MDAIVVTVGIDVGQKVDPTAIAVVETERRGGRDHYLARFLQRLPLGTSYPDIARHLAQIVGNVRAIASNPSVRPAGTGRRAAIEVFVDATGVGTPICDVLSEAGVEVIPVYFTHGDRRVEERGQVSLGKAWLVSRLQALLQFDRLHLPQTEEAKVLAQELIDYEIRVSEDANDRYGAFRVGTHDDLVRALGLAVQVEREFASMGSWLPRPDDADRGPFPAPGPWRL